MDTKWPQVVEAREEVQEDLKPKRDQVRKSPRRLGNTKTTTQQEKRMFYQIESWRQLQLDPKSTQGKQMKARHQFLQRQ